MPPDASWPNIPNPLAITSEDHARHRSPKGTISPGDLMAGEKMTKMAKLAMKFTHKKHLTFKGKLGRARSKKS